MPGQTELLPVIAPGCDGAEEPMDTARVCEELVPQLLLAETEMVPAELPVVTVIELVVDEPVHPEGKVQLYEVAPLTEATE